MGRGLTGRQKLGLKGPVRKVTEEWQSPYESRAELEFDRDGMRVAPPEREVEVHKESHGGRREIRRIASSVDGWSMDGLNDVCFLTRGAVLAETTFTAQGVPSQTVFMGERHDEVSRIRYICDDRGRILEARQENVATAALPQRMTALPRPVTDALREVLGRFTGPEAAVRVTFVYDAEGRVLEQSDYIGEQLHLRTTCTYNENGDKVTFVSTCEPIYTFEYEYDAWRNWIRQVVHHPAGGAEGRRRITYYE